jgi:hypothetical protein
MGLTFKEQLEAVAERLFGDEEQKANGATTSSGLTFELNYPPLPEITVHDLPVAFLKKYWAGYNCYFREEWYAGKCAGFSPLDDFGIETDRMVNIRTFNFSFLTLDRPLYCIFRWLAGFDRATAYTVKSLLHACKVYLYLDLQLRQLTESGFPGGNTYKIVSDALDEFSHQWHFLMLNCYCPIVEECDELGYLEDSAFVIHPQGRRKEERWFFPLVPAGLYEATRFNLKSWDFLR